MAKKANKPAPTGFELSDEDLIGSFAKRPHVESNQTEAAPPPPQEEAKGVGEKRPIPENQAVESMDAPDTETGGEVSEVDRLLAENEALRKRLAHLEGELALVKGSKKERQKAYADQFLEKNASILESGRFQIYISKDTNDTLTTAHGVLTKIPYSHYVDNILKQHIQEYADIIQEAIKEHSIRSLKRFKT